MINWPDESDETLIYDSYKDSLTAKAAIMEYKEKIMELNPEPAKPEFDWPEVFDVACKDENNKWNFFKDNSLCIDFEEWLFNNIGNRNELITNEPLITHLNQLTIGKPWTECKVLRSEVMK